MFSLRYQTLFHVNRAGKRNLIVMNDFLHPNSTFLSAKGFQLYIKRNNSALSSYANRSLYFFSTYKILLHHF